MIKFLVYIAIILTALAIGYLVRILELSATLKESKPEVVTDKDNKTQAKLMLLFLFAFFAFTTWNLIEYIPKMLPIAASEHGVAIDFLFNFNMLIIFIVFAITQFLLFYFAFKYYGRKGRVATFLAHDNKLEMIWTVIPAIVLAVIIIFGLRTWNKITSDPNPASTVVEIYGKQFDWTARFAGADNKLGKANYRLISSTNDLGLDSTSAEGMDDILVKNEIHLPVNKEVAFNFRSRDVIHSAYFPHFRAQMNVVPGMTTMFHFTPTITTAEMRKNPDVIRQMKEINAIRQEKAKKEGRTETPVEFDYILLCNKICGVSHYNMQMTIVIDSEEDYKKWLSGKKPFFKKATASVDSKNIQIAEKK
ncbi:MAG: cytochrome c oxidase subunit II [Bacteroidetes bacterium]|nr:cytochrome c oxidase subunit II [Bacteroidota bacterium]